MKRKRAKRTNLQRAGRTMHLSSVTGEWEQVQRGDLIEFQQYAGRGMRGPEYRPARGRVHLIGPAGPVVTTRSEAMPTVVTEERFIRRVPRSGNRVTRPRDNPGLIGVVSNPPKSSIKRGDRVGYRVSFLRSAGATMGEVPHMKGTVIAEGPLVGKRRTVKVRWDDAPEEEVRIVPVDVLARVGSLAYTSEDRPEYPNPPPVEIGRVVEIRYKHAEDGKYYKHVFQPRPALLVLPDQTLAIWHPTSLPLWKDFGGG